MGTLPGTVFRDAERRVDVNSRRRIAVFTIIAVIAVIAICIAFLAVRPESRAKTKVEDNFKVSCSSISYTATASLRKRLSLSCQVEILDPNFVLGISRAPVIEEVTDDKGGNLEIDSKSPNSDRMHYRAPSTRPQVVAGPKPARWKTIVRSALKMPPNRSRGSRLVHEVRPTRIQIDLSLGPGEQSGQEIGRVKGYFHALVADSFEYVDVPFKTSDKWVRLTPDLEIQVSKAFSEGSRYRLITRTRPEEGGFIWWLSADTTLPGRLPVGRELIGRDNLPLGSWNGMPRLPFNVGGSSEDTLGSKDRITKIRYVIAVNPKHYKIPFVLENIPLPRP